MPPLPSPCRRLYSFAYIIVPKRFDRRPILQYDYLAIKIYFKNLSRAFYAFILLFYASSGNCNSMVVFSEVHLATPTSSRQDVTSNIGLHV